MTTIQAKQRDDMARVFYKAVCEDRGEAAAIYTAGIYNLISGEIGKAISPVNTISIPWVIACLEQYADILRRENPNAGSAADELKALTAKGMTFIKIPTKEEGERENG